MGTEGGATPHSVRNRSTFVGCSDALTSGAEYETTFKPDAGTTSSTAPLLQSLTPGLTAKQQRRFMAR